MSVWFEGQNPIACSIEDVKHAVEDLGEYYLGVIALMPGVTSVELIEQTGSSVTIKTNEGTMKRTNISLRVDADRVSVELDEEYQAGSKVTTRSHFMDEFSATGIGVTHRLVISDVEAPGFLGFFYRKFGRSKIGKHSSALMSPTSRTESADLCQSAKVRDSRSKRRVGSTVAIHHMRTRGQSNTRSSVGGRVQPKVHALLASS